MSTTPFAPVHRAANERAERDVEEARELTARTIDLLAEIDDLCGERPLPAPERPAA